MSRITLLTLVEVIDTLTRYDLEHSRFPHNYFADVLDDIPIIKGAIIDEKNLILIDREQPIEEKRKAIIHELIHAKHYQKGDLNSYKNIERHVDKETILTYKKLYGVKL